MLGYKGFGMQNWIYKNNPRTTFSKRQRLQSSDFVPKHKRNFSPKSHDKENKNLNGILIIAITIVFIFLSGYIYSQFNIYSTERSVMVKKGQEVQNQKAFNFLYESGNSRFKRGNYSAAYSEYKLAYGIEPNNKMLIHKIVMVLTILCEKEVTYCDELDAFLNEN